MNAAMEAELDEPLELASIIPINTIFPDLTPTDTQRYQRLAQQGGADHSSTSTHSRLGGTAPTNAFQSAPNHVALIFETSVHKPAEAPQSDPSAPLESIAHLISHDLHAPLQGIRTAVSWLEAELGTHLSENAQENLAFLRSRADRMSYLLAAVLVYMRTGWTKGSPSRFDSQEAVTEVLTERRAHAAVSWQTSDWPQLYVDRTQFAQTMRHLIDNALRFADERTPLIYLACKKTHEGHEISVSDNGPGIPPEQRSLALQPLRTLVARDVREAAGMGLALSKRWVEGWGGTLGIDDGPFGNTRGTKVWFRVPSTISSAVAPDVTPGQFEREAKTLRVAKETLSAVNQRIRAQNQTFQALLKNMSSAAWLTDVDGSLLLANTTWFGLCNLPEKYPTATSDIQQTFLYTPDLDREVKEFNRAQTLEITHPDDPHRKFLVTRFPIALDAGTQLGGISTEVTEIRAAERALETLNQELTQTNRYLEEFASVASHDLTSPLKKVNLMLDMLARELGPQLSQDHRDMMQLVVTSTHRMRALIGGLRALAQVRIEPSGITWVSLDALVQAAQHELKWEIEALAAVVQVHPPYAQLRVHQTLFEQLLVNLLGNSLKYTRENVPPLIQIWVQVSSEATPELIIKDNGIGFANDDAQRIFRPMVRVSAQGEGLGLGLALCRRIVEAHGAEIYARGVPNKGAEFRVQFEASDVRELDISRR